VRAVSALRESQLPKRQVVVTADQHGTNDSGGLPEGSSAKRKTPKGGTKGAFETGRDDVWAGRVQTFRHVGDAKKGTAGL
jgi:hypothetical protein